MGTRISLKERNDILAYVNSISNDVMINNLISDLINREGVANFFMNDDGSYCFSLVNYKQERVHMLLNSNFIFVSNNFDGIRQQVYCNIDSDGKYISINNFSSIETHDNCIDRTVKVEKRYDSFDNLIYESKVTETKDLNNDLYDNNCSIISKYYIDGQCVKVNSISYDNNSDINRIEHYILDGSDWIRISEDRFIEITNSTKTQKVKLFA